MNPIVINGTVLCDPITGIPRFVYEVVTRLDPLLEGTGLDVRLCYRDDGRPLHLPELKNIKIVPLKAIKYSYNLVVLPRYLRKHHAFYVGLASDMLMTRRSVVVLHDIRPLVMKTDRAFFRFKFWFHCLSTKWFARRVFTVSDNQRHLISERLGIPLDKIGVTYNGWEHLQNVQPDMTVFDKLPGVKKKEYYYALGSLAGHKNFKWVREVAARNPDKTFVVAGGKDLAAFGSAEADAAQNTSNIFYPGYVTDGQNKALMQNCKGFLHPAVFEGFGIPPLEALSLGAPIALARASCLPELYGDTARYFDPYDYDVDLDALFAKPAAPPDKVDSLKLEQIGPGFEHHENFPERINTEFVQVVDAAHLKMRVWERGSGETWACGTGTCATVAALTELGICPAGQDIHVQLRGGELVIRVLPGRQLLMTGSAVTVYEGVAEV